MKWIELYVQTDAEGAEAAAALLNENARGGAAIEQTLTPEAGETLDPARAFTVRAFFSPDAVDALRRAETGLWHLAQLRSMSDPQIRELAEEDWAEAWKKHYAILHIGRRLVVKPTWLVYKPQPQDVVIELDPGMAFGTGLHPTTRLCLAALEDHISPGARVLDVGTGSGILAIAAAKLGAREVLALDVDAIAVETAMQNVASNRVADIVEVRRGALEVAAARNLFDLVCINILAEVIADLAPALASALGSGSRVIASGILGYKADQVARALQAVGIDIIERKPEDDWVALIGQRVDTFQSPISNL